MATLILNEIPPQSVVDTRDAGMNKICGMLPPIPRGYSPQVTRRKTTLLKAGEVVVVDFPGATGGNERLRLTHPGAI